MVLAAAAAAINLQNCLLCILRCSFFASSFRGISAAARLGGVSLKTWRANVGADQSVPPRLIRANVHSLFPGGTNRNLAAAARGHQAVGFISLIEREPVRNNVFRVKTPPDESLDQFLHPPYGSDPGTINRLLIVDDVG